MSSAKNVTFDFLPSSQEGLSFCNWNLNTLCKDDFTRITLLEAHNAEYIYDIIPLCETSLDDNVQVPEMPGYKFYSCNHPDGNRSGGVGVFLRNHYHLKSGRTFLLTSALFAN